MAFAARSAAASHVRGASVARPGAALPRRCSIATRAAKRVVSTDEAAVLTASAAAVLAAAPPAFADEAVVEEAAALYTDAMELAVLEAEEAIKAAEQALESGRVDATVVNAVHTAADAVDAAYAAEQGAVADVVEAGAETVSTVAADLSQAASAMKAAASAAQTSTTDASIVDAIQAAAAAIQAAAASAQDVAGQVQGLVSPAVPVAKEAASFLASASPSNLAEGVLGVVAVAYLAPPLAKNAADRIRGYAGDILPSTAFDALVAQSGNILVDIRSVEEKGDVGVPLLPDMSKFVELEFVTVGDDQLEERLRNSTEVEAELTAVELAALKQLNRGQTIYLMDQSGDMAKAVARELTKRGFSKVFVVSGGCDAWIQAKLRTKAWQGEAAAFNTLRAPSALDEIINVAEKLEPLAEKLEVPEKVKVNA